VNWSATMEMWMAMATGHSMVLRQTRGEGGGTFDPPGSSNTNGISITMAGEFMVITSITPTGSTVLSTTEQ
jgi:hypothetical protein